MKAEKNDWYLNFKVVGLVVGLYMEFVNFQHPICDPNLQLMLKYI